ncbi:MAG: fibrobacter succinogenes major paralogous domain-containing protein [Fibromonadales bacterium]|nr:fibrobacter succinogenes major paralogous domain-containing protein [Fibromonadales bacterium]
MKKVTIYLVLLCIVTFAQQKGSFTDPRDGKEYKTVKIGNQVWMAENLNYNAKNSKCYDNKSENCEKYGRLYSWVTAMEVCPKGWHLPSDEEWQILVDFVGDNEAGEKLKAKSGWNEDGNGMDDYGFSALPGGYGDSENFYYSRSHGCWRSATESDNGDVHWGMSYNLSYVVWEAFFIFIKSRDLARDLNECNNDWSCLSTLKDDDVSDVLSDSRRSEFLLSVRCLKD